MLVLTRRLSEKLVIGNKAEITVTVLGIKGHQVKLGIEAPANVAVDREEVWALKMEQIAKEG